MPQDGVSPRKPIITRTRVAAGSVWETRMKMDEVKGGIKVFNAAAAADDSQEAIRVYRRLRRNQSDAAAAATPEKRKRKSWRPPEPPASPIQLRKARSDLTNSPGTSDRNPGRVGEKRVLLIGDGREDDAEWEEEDDDDEIEIHADAKSFDDKEIDLPPEKPTVNPEPNSLEDEKSIDQVPIASPAVPSSPAPAKVQEIKEKQPPPPPAAKDLNHPPKPAAHVKMPPPSQNRKQDMEEEEEEGHVFERMPLQQNRVQNIVDLVMWRDMSRTAFVFGLGTFILMSSSYAKDIKFSLISSISYLGLVYLAAIFLFRSMLRRGSVEIDGERQIVGEEEAIWLLRLLLPHVNELLIRLRSLFSGDPATTMKMAVVLFVMARCGSSITTWTLVKMVFFGIFTIPKVCSAYKAQLSRYGIFWLERFRDGWESCTHKKAVAAAAFTLIWNVSSIVARVWAGTSNQTLIRGCICNRLTWSSSCTTLRLFCLFGCMSSVFMVVVAVRFYQQRKMEGWSVEEEEEMAEEVGKEEDSKTVLQSAAVAGRVPARHRQTSGPTVRDQTKTKKWT